VHDRDSAFAEVATTVTGMHVEAVRTAPRSPWQNAYVERLIGSIRRECLDHVIVVNEIGLRRVLASYIAYYTRARTHLGLAKDSPEPRPVQSASNGRIVATPEVGGLHHRYDRVAAWRFRSPPVSLLPSSHVVDLPPKTPTKAPRRGCFVPSMTAMRRERSLTTLMPEKTQHTRIGGRIGFSIGQGFHSRVKLEKEVKHLRKVLFQLIDEQLWPFRAQKALQ
jgi:hypothetical protein